PVPVGGTLLEIRDLGLHADRVPPHARRPRPLEAEGVALTVVGEDQQVPQPGGKRGAGPLEVSREAVLGKHPAAEEGIDLVAPRDLRRVSWRRVGGATPVAEHGEQPRRDSRPTAYRRVHGPREPEREIG